MTKRRRQKRHEEEQQVKVINPYDRTPPQSIDMEQALIGALLVDPDALLPVIDIVRPEDFYLGRHEVIFQTILDLFQAGEPVDIITVSEQLKKINLLGDIGGRAYINDLALAVATTSGVRHYAQEIRDKAISRRLIAAGLDIVGQAYDLEADSAVNYAQKAVMDVISQEIPNETARLAQIIPATFEMIESRYTNKGTLIGVSSGFTDLDMLTSGLQASDLIIVGARPSMGKTAFVLNIGTHVALNEQRPVLMFSLEMSKEQLVQRVLCSEAEVDAQRVRLGEITSTDFQRLSRAMGALGDAPFFIDDTPSINPMELRAKAFRQKQESGDLGLIIIDYLQLMEGRAEGRRPVGANREQEISTISRSLKALARDLRVPVIALSQLSRNVESRQDKKPILSDLRESGSIEQDCDVCIFLYRDEYYNPDTDKRGTATVIVAKQRNGPVGEVELLFHKGTTKFKNPIGEQTKLF